MAEAVQPFYPADRAERDREAITGRARPIGLTGPVSRSIERRRRDEACGLGREAKEPLTQVQPAGISISTAVDIPRLGA